MRPTHEDGNTLDLVLVPEDIMNRVSDVKINTLFTESDHFLLRFCLPVNLNVLENKHKYLEYRNYSAMNLDAFKNDIQSTDLFNMCDNTFSSANDACKYYYDTMNFLIYKHCPVIKRRILQKT